MSAAKNPTLLAENITVVGGILRCAQDEKRFDDDPSNSRIAGSFLADDLPITFGV